MANAKYADAWRLCHFIFEDGRHQPNPLSQNGP